MKFLVAFMMFIAFGVQAYAGEDCDTNVKVGSEVKIKTMTIDGPDWVYTTITGIGQKTSSKICVETNIYSEEQCFLRERVCLAD